MKPAARRKARRLALQAIYQWHFNAKPAAELIAQFLEESNPNKVDLEYFAALVTGTLQDIKNLNDQFIPFLDRELKKITPVELAILQISTYELLSRPDVPYKVVINEALESCKTYGAEESFKFINGVLDKLAKVLRTAERHT